VAAQVASVAGADPLVVEVGCGCVRQAELAYDPVAIVVLDDLLDAREDMVERGRNGERIAGSACWYSAIVSSMRFVHSVFGHSHTHSLTVGCEFSFSSLTRALTSRNSASLWALVCCLSRPSRTAARRGSEPAGLGAVLEAN
jgi:hypothetical protein